MSSLTLPFQLDSAGKESHRWCQMPEDPPHPSTAAMNDNFAISESEHLSKMILLFQILRR